MGMDVQRQLSRFKRLPQRNDTWEGAIVALPTWVDDEHGGDPYRAEAAVWVSTSVQLAHVTAVGRPGTVSESVAVGALLEMGTSGKLAGYRPQRIRVRDESLAAVIRQTFEGFDLAVEVTPQVPALDAFLHVLGAEVGDEVVPPALDAPGVTPERLRQFAEAAKQFYEAAPWKHLEDEDLFRVESPKAPRGLGLFTVMGSAGAQFGLAFFSSVDRYDEMMDGPDPAAVLMQKPESVFFLSPAWETTFADLAAWDRYGLPLASSHAYPTVLCAEPDGPQRPDASQLAYIEGLLRALAMSTENELDTGRWSHTVGTANGPVEYVLTLPNLLDAEADAGAPGHGAMTPAEEAQELIAEAANTGGRLQLKLIHRALALAPDSADAYTLLAERTTSAAEERALWEQAVAAGERALGTGAFDNPARVFWEDESTRPYMRARKGLADCLFDQGELDAAAAHLRALLALNAGDNQGARFRLLELLLVADRNDEAAALIEGYGGPDPLWLYAAVLLALRAGDPRTARTVLRVAVKANRHLPKFLTGERELPALLPLTYTLGSRDQAALIAPYLIGPWSMTPNAIAWLRAETRRRR